MSEPSEAGTRYEPVHGMALDCGWLKRSLDEAAEDVQRLPAWAVQIARAVDRQTIGLPRSIEELRSQGTDLPGNPIDLFREG